MIINYFFLTKIIKLKFKMENIFMSLKDVGNKVPIYKLKTTDEVMKYYDEWGEKKNIIKIWLSGIIQDQKKLLRF